MELTTVQTRTTVMPPKGKHVHTTRSVTARSRLNSPLRVKVQKNLARTKPKEHSKQPLKSIVKVVNNKQAKAKSVSFLVQDSATLASQPPKQTAFTDAMEKWKDPWLMLLTVYLHPV